MGHTDYKRLAKALEYSRPFEKELAGYDTRAKQWRDVVVSIGIQMTRADPEFCYETFASMCNPDDSYKVSYDLYRGYRHLCYLFGITDGTIAPMNTDLMPPEGYVPAGCEL